MNRTEWFALLFVSLRPPRGFSFSFCLCSALRIAALLLLHPAAPPARTISPLQLLRTPLCPSADRTWSTRALSDHCSLRTFLRRGRRLTRNLRLCSGRLGSVGVVRLAIELAHPHSRALAAAMHSRAMFYVELAFHVATLMALWPLYLSQLAVFRCIPRRKRIDTKVRRADEEEEEEAGPRAGGSGGQERGTVK
jgi:hypothetical protein